MPHLDGRMDPAKDAKPQDRQPVKDGASGTSVAAARAAKAARTTGQRRFDPDVPGTKEPRSR